MLTSLRTEFRVRYPEVDRMGIAHHTAYLVWFELGRTEFMRETGVSYARLEDDEGLLFPVVDLSAHYHTPARYDELLEVETTVGDLDRLRVRFDYRILRSDARRPLAEGHTLHVATNGSGRPRRIPRAILEVLSPETGARS